MDKYKDGRSTERLYTRFLKEDDYRAWVKFLEDKEAIQYLIRPENSTLDEWAQFWIEKQMLRYKENRGGLQVLINKSTHEFIGLCGLLIQDIDGKQEIEVGYHIFKKYWGQGYAPEAAKAFLNYGFSEWVPLGENKSVSSIISIIHINNEKSQRVADKNGLKRDKQVRWMDLDVFIYRIEKPQFE